MQFRKVISTATVVLAALAASQLTAQSRANDQEERSAKHSWYKLVDLGTLGGPQSYFASSPVEPYLNNKGIAVGGTDLASIDPNSPNCASKDCHTLRAFEWQDGELRGLPTLPGGHNNSAYGINGSGLVMGGSDNGLFDPLGGFPQTIAVVWRPRGRIVSLGTLDSGGTFSFANALNDRGQVVGIATNNTPDPYSYLGGYLGIGTQTRAFVWDGDHLRELGTLGGPDSWAAAVNEAGQVAGWADTEATTPDGVPVQHPFIWEKGAMLDLGTLGGSIAVVGSFQNSGSSGAINNRGEVIGTSALAGDLVFHPFFWQRGHIRDLGTLGGNNADAFWINDASDVVGESDVRATLPGTNTQMHHGFLWRQGSVSDLGTVGSDPCSRALAENSRGQIVGASTSCHEYLHAFLWENGGPMVDLNSLVLPGSAAVQLTTVASINDHGEIAANGTLPDGDQHDFLLIPCDEDHRGVSGCEGARTLDAPSGHFGAGMEVSGHKSTESLPPIRARQPRAVSSGVRNYRLQQ